MGMHVEEISRRIRTIEGRAKINLGKAQDKYKSIYDIYSIEREYQPGAKLLLTDPTSKVFDPRYTAPLTVIQSQLHGPYLIEDESGKRQTVHVNRHKPFRKTDPDREESVHVVANEKRGIKIPSRNKEYIESFFPTPGNAERCNVRRLVIDKRRLDLVRYT
ncbi:hypothetical protein RF11_07108 [Thelohanellus kitauei]|nr:hypothetical protein RF11_07108 [Thelohanellus kitauei]